jgi:hypothetical protein
VSETIDYPALLAAATRGMVRDLLARAAAHGLPGAHHLYLTFRTAAAGVTLPPGLRARYPETMTIVLQHQFAELAVEEDAFAVTLRFGGLWQRLRVPFAALTSFVDPSVPFGLDFTQFAAAAETPGGAVGEPPASGPVADLPAGAPRGASAAGERPAGAGDDDGPPGPPDAGGVLPFRRR